MQNPAEKLKTIPLTILIPDLLSQFNKPTLFGKRNIKLTKVEIDAIAAALADGSPLPDHVSAINEALADIIQESVTLLQERFGLTFDKALRTTDISKVAAWETTADFLEIANHKSNAELRISAGTSLMVFLGDVRHAKYLLTLIKVDNNTNDVDAMIAKRAFSHTLQLDIDTDNWLQTVETQLNV